MRIISGIYRGKQIHPPKNLKLRPTTDFAKESLFNILIHQFDFENLDILDLFAGTGSITYEFASRNVRSIVTVEMVQVHFKFIQKTCSELEMDQVTVIREDAFRYLKNPYQSFDIIFADPPYDHPRLAELPDMVFSTEILTRGGLFILEHPASYTFSAHPGFFQHRKYGGVNFTMFSSDTANQS
ncbi:MAG: RsmD family RNA methyltransferase [Bacteroidales bacterium]|nr:RsmD family RNA methyltransferase [Bacteroidales bacterium]